MGIRKTNESESLLTCRYEIKGHRNRGVFLVPGWVWRVSELLARRCPAWRRREPDLRRSHGTWEGTPRFCCQVVARGSASSSRNCEALSTDAGRAGGPARSSDEAPVMGVERRGRTIRVGEAVNRRVPGGAG